ncbi:MAG: bifunctional [glutamine synthetase] adenylyltransferase/[glutamine synthetase]-adenylyl-L-tyrosine phosphorylase [Nitratireductor sp.]|nr:bifunctional [glutamine synthetase] adenylyltransferase/[glutamine synthetase]-adenylyl-L-tyrosine phosphorylase [Nitratireductor sp.]
MSALIALETPPLQLAASSAGEAKKWLGELDNRLKQEELGDWREAIAARQDIREFLGAVFSHSSFLRDCALIRPALLCEILSRPFRESFDELVRDTTSAWRNAASDTEIMAHLRIAKRKAALLCGLADLGQWWSAAEVTKCLTGFAGAALGASVNHLLLQLHNSGKLVLHDPQDPSLGSGLIVLAMGKFGAGELNYSSDIDLILFFEKRLMQWNTDDPVSLYTRFAKALIRIMQERTGDGYVFRTDLRLRPDPGSTPLVIPVETALHYYEAYGQNWERAAMIKARPVAGDLEAGRAVLNELAPFIWRKYLDYAAISDVHSIKRQIHAHRGHGEIKVAGHNIKLGRGGIREIEFFAQTQQLIAGGRLPVLREIRTLDALAALCREGWIDTTARDELGEAYWYLRNVEHRIQMMADEQSHTLPEDRKGLTHIALMMGESSVDAFSQNLTRVLRRVEKHYAGLFETSPELTVPGGNLVFTGDDDDPATVETLSVMGYSRPSEVIKIVRGWHYGRFAAVQTAQARELLTELTPGLLQAVAASGEPDATLISFDRFLGGLPAGIQFFSIMKSNPGMLQLMLLMLGSAPRLADIITRRPHVFDGLIEPAFAGVTPDRVTLRERLALSLARSPDHESRLDAARIFAAEQKFLIGARLITGQLSASQAARAFANLAEVLIQAMVDAVSTEFAVRHGTVPGAKLCVLGMGRLGSRELTAGSDLDLILLYQHDPDAELSTGEKPLAPSQYFMRLTQRLIAAMSAPTAQGVLYELDFRLRPSGNAGPLATEIGAFLRYQKEEAWTWERLALTRARAVAGDPEFCQQVEEAINGLLTKPTERASLDKDVREMRALIDKEKGSTNPFEVKTAKGGLIDIEFLAQWAMLASGCPEDTIRPVGIADMLAAVPATLISEDDCAALRSGLDLYNTVQQILRLCIDDKFDPATAPAGLSRMICEALDLPEIRTVEAHLKETQKLIRSIFTKTLG